MWRMPTEGRRGGCEHAFYIQLLAEAAALCVLSTIDWPRDGEHWLMSGAGKFLLKGPRKDDTENKLNALQQDFSDWLIRNTRAELRLALGWADGHDEVNFYRAAMAYGEARFTNDID